MRVASDQGSSLLTSPRYSSNWNNVRRFCFHSSMISRSYVYVHAISSTSQEQSSLVELSFLRTSSFEKKSNFPFLFSIIFDRAPGIRRALLSRPINLTRNLSRNLPKTYQAKNRRSFECTYLFFTKSPCPSPTAEPSLFLSLLFQNIHDYVVTANNTRTKGQDCYIRLNGTDWIREGDSKEV